MIPKNRHKVLLGLIFLLFFFLGLVVLSRFLKKSPRKKLLRINHTETFEDKVNLYLTFQLQYPARYYTVSSDMFTSYLSQGGIKPPAIIFSKNYHPLTKESFWDIWKDDGNECIFIWTLWAEGYDLDKFTSLGQQFLNSQPKIYGKEELKLNYGLKAEILTLKYPNKKTKSLEAHVRTSSDSMLVFQTCNLRSKPDLLTMLKSLKIRAFELENQERKLSQEINNSPIFKKIIKHLKLLGKSPSTPISDINSNLTIYQPINFTPGKLKRIAQMPDIPGVVYEIPGEQNFYVAKESHPLKTVKLISYRFFFYTNTDSYYLESYKNNMRDLIFRDVLFFTISPKNDLLYVIQFDRTTHSLKRKIVNLATGKQYMLQSVKCVEKNRGFWQENYLITYSFPDSKNEGTEFCIWDQNAELFSRLWATPHWGSASEDFLAEQVGLIPGSTEIFYMYSSLDESTCALYLADLTTNSVRVAKILDKTSFPDSYFCLSPKVKFDFSQYSNGIIKYKIKNEESNKWKTIYINNLKLFLLER